MTETIFAKASGAGKSGVAIFRISGPDAPAILATLSGREIVPREVAILSVSDPRDGAIIDRGLAIWFAAPASFTGEHVVELQLHGSRAVEEALYDVLNSLRARPAEAGEFTLRALKNGKLDLAQVEALADLIDAETTLQRKQALGQLDGRLSALAEGWRKRLLSIMAPLEADIDFPDEGGVPAAVAARAGPEIDVLKKELMGYLKSSASARAIRDGVRIAVIGAPNAGKSSFVNQLAGTDIAIVSSTPGTTRDVIETRLDLGGLAVTIADTAGLRNLSTDEIEIAGMTRALARAEKADFRILVVDASTSVPRETFFETGDDQVSRETLALLRPADFVVWNKDDLVQGRARQAVLPASPYKEAVVSAKTGQGVEEFLAILSQAVAQYSGGGDEPALTRARHVNAVKEAFDALTRAEALISTAPELAAEDARLAVRLLGGITGVVGVEDVLGEIFSSFCIGK